MSKMTDDRKRVAIVACIIVGLVLGFFIKRVSIGLIIGLVLGLLVASMLVSKK